MSSPPSPSELLALLRDAAAEPNAELRRLQLTIVHAHYVRLFAAWKQAEKDFREWSQRVTAETESGNGT